MTVGVRNTAESRDLAVLDELSRSERVSQRDLADRTGMSLGFLNRCLRRLIDNGSVVVADRSERPYKYRVTSAGKRRLLSLTYDHYRSVVGSFLTVERRIRERLEVIRSTGAQRVVFYGAGEVMEVAQLAASTVGLELVAAVDDDECKQGTTHGGLAVLPPAKLAVLDADAVVITTFRYADGIRGRIPRDGPEWTVWHL